MKLYNSMTRQKEEFVPVEEGKVGMYSCGPTVYNYFHIGNARPFIIFDVLRNFLTYIGYDVTFVQNFTDIDDKMIKKANEEGTTVKAVADKYIAEYFKDAEGLGIKKADVHPKATENIDAIIDIIKTLEEKGYAYAVDGDVYFRTKKFDGYGKLSHQPLEVWSPARASAWTNARRTPWILPFGKRKKRASPPGKAPGARAGRAGTLSARPW